LEQPHPLSGDWHPSLAESRRARRANRSRLARAVSAVAWYLLSLGLAGFVCGGVLSGWSLVAHRAELWNVGMPIALGGQLALLLGLILQLDRLGQDNRRQAETLDQVGRQLDRLTSRRRIDAPEGYSPASKRGKAVLTASSGSKNIRPPSVSASSQD
jgi:hypothetical protein